MMVKVRLSFRGRLGLKKKDPDYFKTSPLLESIGYIISNQTGQLEVRYL